MTFSVSDLVASLSYTKHVLAGKSGYSIQDQIAEGDKVVPRWTVTGTQQGEFAGVPATGKSVSVSAINIHRVTRGQIQEAWFNWDALGMMQQLGVVPAPE